MLDTSKLDKYDVATKYYAEQVYNLLKKKCFHALTAPSAPDRQPHGTLRQPLNAARSPA